MPNSPSSAVNLQSFEVKSPLSGKVIIRKDPVTGDTERFICDRCVKYVAERRDTHALDPIFFWGAGIYEYQTHITPVGTRAFLNREALGRLIRSMPYDLKRKWEKITGLPFPFKFVKSKPKAA